MLHEFDEETQAAIRQSLPEDLLAHADAGAFASTRGTGGRHWAPEPDAVAVDRRPPATLPRQGGGGDGDRRAAGPGCSTASSRRPARWRPAATSSPSRSTS